MFLSLSYSASIGAMLVLIDQQFKVSDPQPMTTLVVPADDSDLDAEPQYLPTF